VNQQEDGDHLRRLAEKLEQRKQVDVGSGCWIWMGATTKAGYGELRVGPSIQYVHRLSAVLHLRLDPESSLYVLHVCDVRGCFNPDHLFLGTQKDNMQDAARKGRLGRGKLNADRVREIRLLLSQGWTQRRLAERYDVSSALIGQIARGQVWRHVDDGDDEELLAA
jgi:hypothetical protein